MRRFWCFNVLLHIVFTFCEWKRSFNCFILKMIFQCPCQQTYMSPTVNTGPEVCEHIVSSIALNSVTLWHHTTSIYACVHERRKNIWKLKTQQSWLMTRDTVSSVGSGMWADQSEQTGKFGGGLKETAWNRAVQADGEYSAAAPDSMRKLIPEKHLFE